MLVKLEFANMLFILYVIIQSEVFLSNIENIENRRSNIENGDIFFLKLFKFEIVEI